MRKLITAMAAAAFTLQMAAPALASDMFNRNTMLGWRHQTGPGVVAYFRAPIGPSSLKTSSVRTGLAITGPRAYGVGQVPLYSQGPRLLDFAFAKRSEYPRWNAQLAVGNAVAWTNDPKGLKPGQVNLMESGVSWVIVGAITVGLGVAVMSMIEEDKPANP